MWTYPQEYDVVVIGGGHAGCEAAHAAAKMGCRTLLLTMSLDTIGKMSCNPAIGGTAKGHLVREIDALGGIMGKVADQSSIQGRMLNRTKGPAVWSPRCQADKWVYQQEMKYLLEQMPNVSIKQGTIESLVVEENSIKGVTTLEGIQYRAKTVIISAGTFMRGLLHIGSSNHEGGRAGDRPSIGLSANLQRLGFELGRLKTGTPPRIHRQSIDFSRLEEQKGEDDVHFSFDPPSGAKLQQVSCFITYTNAKTKEIVLNNLHLSPMYSGKIQATGVRYCPSIEDKIYRFADKERHQIFLEPEGLTTEEVYVNGISSSLPPNVQLDMLHSIEGLEHAELMRPAYAIEYDYVKSGQISISLETHKVKNLFLAGQVNGTTGYEEAASQGLIAGINAACKVLNKDPFILKRSEAYIGVLIDEITSKELDEPYRMFTSRAEHRLVLRQDNAHLRLRHLGYQSGLIDEARYQKLLSIKQTIETQTATLRNTRVRVDEQSVLLSQLLCRPEIKYATLLEQFPMHVSDHGDAINHHIEFELKYEGYIQRQKKQIDSLDKTDDVIIPEAFDFARITGLRNEAKEKLIRFRPKTVGQASRISGVSPADISLLMIYLKKFGKV